MTLLNKLNKFNIFGVVSILVVIIVVYLVNSFLFQIPYLEGLTNKYNMNTNTRYVSRRQKSFLVVIVNGTRVRIHFYNPNKKVTESFFHADDYLATYKKKKEKKDWVYYGNKGAVAKLRVKNNIVKYIDIESRFGNERYTMNSIIIQQNKDLIKKRRNEALKKQQRKEMARKKEISDMKNKMNSHINDKHHDDLYILKSKIVPPVCPTCPTLNNHHYYSSSNDTIPHTHKKDKACCEGHKCNHDMDKYYNNHFNKEMEHKEKTCTYSPLLHGYPKAKLNSFTTFGS